MDSALSHRRKRYSGEDRKPRHIGRNEHWASADAIDPARGRQADDDTRLVRGSKQTRHLTCARAECHSGHQWQRKLANLRPEVGLRLAA